MMLVPPHEQFLASYTITTPATGFRSNFVNVVAPAAVIGTLLFDGVAVPAASFTPIGTSGFSGAQIPITLGAHRVSAPLPFGVFVYGFDAYDSYGYPGGMSLAPIAVVTTVTLSPLDATILVGATHCVDAAVRDQNNQPVPGVRVDFSVTGANSVAGFGEADSAGNARFCYAGTVAGADEIVGVVGAIRGTARATWQAQLTVDPGGPYTCPEGGSVMVQATSTLPGTVTFAWDLDGDGLYEKSGARALFLAGTADGPSNRTIRVRATSSEGTSAEATTQVAITNVAPGGNFSVTSVYYEGGQFQLSISGAFDNGKADLPTLRFAFDCGDGSGYGPLGAGRSVTCSVVDDGVRTVRGMIVDKDGGATEYTGRVATNNKAPQVTIQSPAALSSFPVGATVDLQAAFTDAGVADVHACMVAWGDGTQGVGVVSEASGSGHCSASHAYSKAGTFSIAVTVTDDDGGLTTKRVRFVVQ